MNDLISSKPLIMIVDDQAANIRTLEGALEADYRIVTATSGKDALAIISKNTPDLVLLDVMMPDMDGHETCLKLKQQPENKDIPVIFIAANNDIAEEEKGFILGAVDFITKPFSMPVVKCRVRYHVNQKLKSDWLEHKALIDPLTLIPNRGRFDEALKKEWDIATRDGTSIALVMLDVDFFKHYNDNYGHGSGDACLQKVAKALAATVNTNPSDMVARYGGEEFVALLPRTDAEGARLIAERFRSNVEALQLPHEHSDVSSCVTISVGLASLIPMAGDVSENLLKQADVMLYQAKQSGRNKVCAVTA